jgi:hypothetical protein
MPPVERFVFAYDARGDPTRIPQRPPEDFDLLAVDSTRVLSADRHVWAPVEPGADLGWVPPRDLAAIEQAVATVPFAWIVALELRSKLRKADETGRGELWPAAPPTVQSGWSLLGLDVIDEATLSVINFFGLGKDATLRNRYRSKLGENGMFTSDADASEFLAVAEARLPEDAPFYVVGLWLVR